MNCYQLLTFWITFIIYITSVTWLKIYTFEFLCPHYLAPDHRMFKSLVSILHTMGPLVGGRPTNLKTWCYWSEICGHQNSKVYIFAVSHFILININMHRFHQYLLQQIGKWVDLWTGPYNMENILQSKLMYRYIENIFDCCTIT